MGALFVHLRSQPVCTLVDMKMYRYIYHVMCELLGLSQRGWSGV